MQGISRSLWEEATFDNNAVTSVDWLTYPILHITETPERIDFALIIRPELPASGAGTSTGQRRPPPMRSSTPRVCGSGGCRSRQRG